MAPPELQPGPGDVPHIRKWSAPTVEERKEWASKEALPFLELFDACVTSTPDKPALTWMDENGKQGQAFTYAELDGKSRTIAGKLLGDWKAKSGDRVVLLYPPGLEFLVAFIACLRAGVVAVPVYPPNPNALSKDMPKLQRVVEDSGASLVLTSARYMNVVRLSQLRFIRWPGKSWQTTDNVKVSQATSTEFRAAPGGQVAFLQYTSGSTAEPKGVMVGHDNIAHNVMFVRRTLRLTDKSRFFSWLPQYHDLGLIVAYLGTLSAGASGFYMSPISFIRSPPLWLQLMSRLQITHTAAPNFALDLTCRKFDPATDAPEGGLDLSQLESLLNAAEPVRPDSIARWNAALAPHGWHPSSMTPCYGLAEHVVGVVGWGTKVMTVREEGGRERVVHSSGSLATFPHDGRVLTVDPHTRVPCTEGAEGEIWVRSRHVTLGYWNKPELSQEVFGGRLAEGAAGGDDGLYLRTGDLGVVVGDQLFVTGRIKDLIILRGKNYHPEDIEKTVEAAWESVRAGCVAAFSTELGPARKGKEAGKEAGSADDEVVAIVAELRDGSFSAEELSSATAAIRKAVVTTHGVFPAIVALISPRTIPKTTSGKIRRGETKKQLATGALKILNKAVHLQDSHSAEAEEAEQRSAEQAAEMASEDATANGGGPHVDAGANGVTGLHDGAPPPPAANGAAPAAVPGPVEKAVLTLIRAKQEDVKPETSLIDLGLTSMDGIDVFGIIKKASGYKLTPEEVEVMTVADLRSVDQGKGLPDLKARAALNTGETPGAQQEGEA